MTPLPPKDDHLFRGARRMLEGFATKDLKNQLLSGPSEAEPDIRPASPAESRATRLIASLCGPHLRRRLHETSPAVGNFINGTLLYVLSRQWQDLLATNVFHLHPLPFCDTRPVNTSRLPCTPEASSGAQLRFAAGLLCVAAVVQHVSLCKAAQWPSLAIVPRMVGMCVGWAFGFAALQALSEMDAALGGVAQPWVMGVAVSASATLGSALVILACQPATLCVGWAAEQMEELWPMCSHALSVMARRRSVPSPPRRTKPPPTAATPLSAGR